MGRGGVTNAGGRARGVAIAAARSMDSHLWLDTIVSGITCVVYGIICGCIWYHLWLCLPDSGGVMQFESIAHA
jgi:hypothetical protein